MELTASTQRVLELEAKIRENERKEAQEETVTKISKNETKEAKEITVIKIETIIDEKVESNEKISAVSLVPSSHVKHPELMILSESESINELRETVRGENVEETLSKDLSEVQSRLERELKAAYSPVREGQVVVKSSPIEIAYLQLQVEFRDKSASYDNLLQQMSLLSQKLLEAGCKVDDGKLQVASSNTEFNDSEQKNSLDQKNSSEIREISDDQTSSLTVILPSQMDHTQKEGAAGVSTSLKIKNEVLVAGEKEVASLQKRVEDCTSEISLLTGRLQSMESTNSQLSNEVKEKQEEKDDL